MNVYDFACAEFRQSANPKVKRLFRLLKSVLSCENYLRLRVQFLS